MYTLEMHTIYLQNDVQTQKRYNQSEFYESERDTLISRDENKHITPIALAKNFYDTPSSLSSLTRFTEKRAPSPNHK